MAAKATPMAESQRDDESIDNKKMKNDIDDQHQPSSLFMSTVSDDLLIEIFLRLTSGRALTCCAAVCKRWSSLISPQLISTFTQFHRHKPPSDYAYSLLFSEPNKPFHQISSEKRQLVNPNYHQALNFLPDWPNVEIRASCDDLLLVSVSESKYYVCNPFTRKWTALPEVNEQREVRAFGLVCERGGAGAAAKYKVMLAFPATFMRGNSYSFRQCVFCSVTGRWLAYDREMADVPRMTPKDSAHGVDVVAKGGFVYWLEGAPGREFYKGVVANDLFGLGLRSHFIGLPREFSRRCRIRQPCCLGLVRGRLRLAEVVVVNCSSFRLTVWELEPLGAGGDKWRMVHRARLLRSESGAVFGLALNPDDGGEVFVFGCEGGGVFRFKIEEGRLEKIGRLGSEEFVVARLKVVTIVHPLWPTELPAISNHVNALQALLQLNRLLALDIIDHM